MAELSAVSVRITGDARGLEAAVESASGDLRNLAAVADQTTRRTGGLTSGFNALGGAFNRNRGAIQNASYQLQDVVVQMQMGTSATRALSMQLPQLASGFGAIGAVVGTLVGVGLPLLASYLWDADGGARSASDTIDELRGVMDVAADATDVLAMSQLELRNRFGESANAALQAAGAIREFAIADMGDILRQTAAGASDIVEEFSFLGDEAQASQGLLDAFFGHIQNQFGVSRDSAQQLAYAFNDIRAAATTEEQVAAFQALNRVMDETGVSADRIPAALRDAIAEALTLGNVLAEARQQMVGMTYGSPLEAVTLPGDEPSRRRGGGGRSAPRANPLVSQLETLRNSLMSQTELELANYAQRQEMLQQALEQRLLTQQEYDGLIEQEQRRHSGRMADLDVYRYGTTLQRTDAFLGSMAQAFASGNEEMLRVSRAFGAAQALISAWQGAAEALKLPFPANLAAFAQVLATGMGAVQAIQGVTKGGGGAASVGSGGMAVAQAQRPLQATLNLQGPLSDLFGGALGDLLDGLNAEAGDRGYQLLTRRA